MCKTVHADWREREEREREREREREIEREREREYALWTVGLFNSFAI